MSDTLTIIMIVIGVYTASALIVYVDLLLVVKPSAIQLLHKSEEEAEEMKKKYMSVAHIPVLNTVMAVVLIVMFAAFSVWYVFNSIFKAFK